MREAIDQLRKAYDHLLLQLERLHRLMENSPSDRLREGLERKYEALSEQRQRIALALDLLEGRAVVEDRGTFGRHHYLVILSGDQSSEVGYRQSHSPPCAPLFPEAVLSAPCGSPRVGLKDHG